MKLYELIVNTGDGVDNEKVYFRTEAPVTVIERTLAFVKLQEDYNVDMFINAVRAVGHKISLVNLEPVDVFEI